MVFEHFDVGVCEHLFGKGCLDGGTGRVGGMNDATVRVATLTG